MLSLRFFALPNFIPLSPCPPTHTSLLVGFLQPSSVPICVCVSLFPSNNYTRRYRCALRAVAKCARSSSPALISGFADFCPSGLSVRVISSLSIRSRVVFVSSSTSAALRWVVGMGLRTRGARSQLAGLCLLRKAVPAKGWENEGIEGKENTPFTGIRPPLNLLSLTLNTPA